MVAENSPQPGSSDRRKFLLTSAGLGAAGVTAFSSENAQAAKPAETPLIAVGDTVLFQGDSITDAGRSKEKDIPPNDIKAFGSGYASIAASQMLVSWPEGKLQCHNRGISGNKVFQLAERLQEDCLDLEPDVLSILIGVNDIWHTRKHGYDGTVEIYERDYHALLERTKQALPDVKLVICEPFVLKYGAVDDAWFPEFDEYRAAARRVADQAGARFVAFQQMFDRAVEYAPPEHWLRDGVHPTDSGAALMAHAWLEAVGA